MGDYFYFHFDNTMLEEQRPSPIRLSESNIVTTLNFNMQKYFDETKKSVCSHYTYNDQQGEFQDRF